MTENKEAKLCPFVGFTALCEGCAAYKDGGCTLLKAAEDISTRLSEISTELKMLEYIGDQLP